jgi:hypothetical protein
MAEATEQSITSAWEVFVELRKELVESKKNPSANRGIQNNIHKLGDSH